MPFKPLYIGLFAGLQCGLTSGESRSNVETDDDARRARLISEIFRDLPVSFEDRFAKLVAIRKNFHAELANATEKPLNFWLKSMPQKDAEDKRQIAIVANNRLHALHLAVASPGDGEPSILAAYVRDAEYDAGRFRIERRGARNRRIPTSTFKELPYLTIVEDPPRKEPLAGLVDTPVKPRSR